MNPTVAFPSDGYFVDHNRVIYLHLKVQDASRFYEIILGPVAPISSGGNGS